MLTRLEIKKNQSEPQVGDQIWHQIEDQAVDQIRRQGFDQIIYLIWEASWRRVRNPIKWSLQEHIKNAY